MIEDDDNLVHSLARSLRQSGYDPIRERTGDMGLDAAVVFDPDAILLDLGLPGMRGTKVLEELKQLAPHIPVVVISGALDADQLVGHWRAVRRVFHKPFHAHKLVAFLDELLRPPLD